MDPSTLSSIGEFIVINILLSGDNAVVIALACRALPPEQRKWGVALGAGAAVLLRVLFTLVVVRLMALPWLKLVGGLLLLGIAIKLIRDEDAVHDVKASHSVWSAVRTIAIADTVMSLDNVVAIAAAAKGSMPLIIFGLLLSIPLVVFGSTLLMKVIDRFPVLVWAGAALLGWVAGDIISDDPVVHGWVGTNVAAVDLWLPPVCAALVLASARLLTWRPSQRKPR